MARPATTIAITLLFCFARNAGADPEPMRDGVIIGGAAAVALVLNYLPVHEQSPLREREWFSLDDRVRDNYSDGAAVASDVSLALAVAVPAGFAIGGGPGASDRALVIAESVSLALLATSITKDAFARPRPYVYNDDPRAARKRSRAGRDAYRSLFSGHAAMSFAAVGASGAMFASRDTTTTARALVWGTGTMLAASTASLRVRAGRHFYSDVFIGAALGGAIGTLVPALQTGALYVPSGREWAGIGGGLALGVLAAQLLPFGTHGSSPVDLAPLVMRGGAGLAISGAL